MKAERRHELQQNELADWMASAIEQIKPHAGVIVGVVAAALLALVAMVYLSGRSETRGGPAWDGYFRAMEIEAFDQRVKELTRVADEHPGTPAGLWAELSAAEARLIEGTNKSFKVRSTGEEEISKAIGGFEKVAAAAAKLPPAQGEMLRTQALWGLAEAHESLFEVEPAIEQYQKLAKLFPETALGKEAVVRAKKLQGMEDWYKWYASVDPTTIKPTPRDRQPPLDFTPPRQPQPYDDLPDDPDLTLPGPLDPTLGGGLLLDPPGDTPETPADDAPADDAPGEIVPPADGETPSDTPAEGESAEPAPPAEGDATVPPSEDAGEGETPPSSEDAKPEGENP